MRYPLTVLLSLNNTFIYCSVYLDGYLVRSSGTISLHYHSHINSRTKICKFCLIFSIIYIQGYFRDTSLRPLQGLLPSKAVLVGYFLSYIVTSSSETMFCCTYGWLWRLCHIATGGLCLLALAFTIYVTEEKLVQFVKKQLFSKLRTKLE